MQSADPQTLCWSGQERKKSESRGNQEGARFDPRNLGHPELGGLAWARSRSPRPQVKSHPRSGAAGLALLVPANRGWAAIPGGKDLAAVRALSLSLASLAYREEIHPVFLPSFEALPPSSPQPGQ